MVAYNAARDSQPSNTTSGATPIPPLSATKIEVGQVQVNHIWKTVTLTNTYTHPVVIAKPLSKNGADPSTVAIRNVTSNSFQVRVHEWDYLDGIHVNPENLSYLVMEAGHYTLPNGAAVEAGTLTTDRADVHGAWPSVTFGSPFATVPVMATSIMTANGQDAATTRNRSVTNAGFQTIMQEQEANAPVHINETIGFLAWEAGQGTIGGLNFQVGLGGDFTDAWGTIGYGPFTSAPPALLYGYADNKWRRYFQPSL